MSLKKPNIDTSSVASLSENRQLKYKWLIIYGSAYDELMNNVFCSQNFKLFGFQSFDFERT
jgi:hypothetical protein